MVHLVLHSLYVLVKKASLEIFDSNPHRMCMAQKEWSGRGGGEGLETTIYIGFDTIVFNIRLVLKWVRQFESMLCGVIKVVSLMIRNGNTRHSCISIDGSTSPFTLFPLLLLFRIFFLLLESIDCPDFTSNILCYVNV